MIYFLFILCLLLVSNYKFYQKGYCQNYLDKYHCNVIKGLFIGIVFMDHFSQYVKLNNYLDIPYIHFMHYVNQFEVALFLFYSGYGLMVSIMQKRIPYIKKLPSHRILRTLIHFDVAVSLYLIISIWKHGIPSVKAFALGFIGWGGFGNSNWYIFAILVLWMISFVVFYVFRTDKYILQISMTTLLTVTAAYLISLYKQPYWYNTLLCFPLGMSFALYKNKLEKIFFESCTSGPYLFTIIFCGAGTYIFGKHQANFYLYEVWILFFTVFTVLITMKFEFNNSILAWMGKHLFEIYILMRLPMILLQPYFKGHNYHYLVISAIITGALVVVFTPFLKWLDVHLFQVNKKRRILNE